MLGLFRKPKADQGKRRQLEATMHAALGLGPDDSVRASEVACGAYGCADVVTVLLVMRARRRTELFRADKPLAAVEPEDFVSVDAPEASRRSPPS